MDTVSVSTAVAARRSIRRFIDRPVDLELLRDILDKARQSPSGGNVQPWHVSVLSGQRLERLKQETRVAMMKGQGAEPAEYDIYPAELSEPYWSRRKANGEALFGSLGIAREDKPARQQAVARNFELFGAPVGLFLHTPKYMGKPQWADLGIWLQTVMLLLVEAGLGSCAQEAWAHYPATVKRVAEIPDEHILYSGLAIGYPDPDAPVNSFPNARAPLEESVVFLND